MAKVKVIVKCTEGGKTEPPAGEYEREIGETLTLTAIPDEGYKLDHWLLDWTVPWGHWKDENPLTVIVSGNHVIVAVFDENTGTWKKQY